MFDEVESLQIYHLLAESAFYEQGTIDRELSFYETAIGFWATSTGEKAVFSYEPSSGRLSLLPDVGPPGGGDQIVWKNTGHVYYEANIDPDRWEGFIYMGTMGGSTFEHILETALWYATSKTAYQPFSVYREFPGHRYVSASSCDEFVWYMFDQLASLQINLTPVAVPKKVRIILYAAEEPEDYPLDTPEQRQEVASYFRSLKLCLHMRSLRSLDTLNELTGFYSGCMNMTAYLYKNNDEVYKVSLSVPFAGSLFETDEVPPPAKFHRVFNWVDITLMLLILGMSIAGLVVILQKSTLMEKCRHAQRQKQMHALHDERQMTNPLHT